VPDFLAFLGERWSSRLVATAAEDRLSFSAANNGQQEKSPSSEAGARLGFDGSNNNGRPLSPQQRDF